MALVTAGRKKALIVGAGIGGLTAALFLQRNGWETVIFEKKSSLDSQGAGIVLAANAIHVLQELGLAEQVKQAGACVGQADIRTWDGRPITAVPVKRQAELYGTYSYLIHRAKLQAILAGRLQAGTALHLRSTMVAVDQDEHRITARFEDGTAETGDVLIGADGIHSAVVRELFPIRPLRYSGYTAFRGVTPFTDAEYSLEAGGGFESWGSGKRFGFSQLGEGLVFWFAAINAPEGMAVPDRKDYVLQQFGGWQKPIEAVVRATDSASILRHDIYDCEPLDHWSRSRVVLLGDAAHAMLPNLGQGGAQAMEDAFVLAACLQEAEELSATGIAAAYRAYEGIRLPRANRVLRQSRRMARMVQMQHPFAMSIRNRVLRFVPDAVTVKQLHWLLGYRVSTIERQV
ncbi:2-polyprenyl-6-methoxyphenol hydroxylase-like FAD-dependent oxidoreductase [Bacillus sp. 3255]|nr:2-polyprenyl-6-methoxyphenol hydroxylase-like FAD-dependent oxidoreductase [Bacillus sp. 3255]